MGEASVYALSGGMAQRLMVARAILHRPAVLFLDEPTAGLDPQSRLALWEILGELNRDGQTIILATHYMEEADQLCEPGRDHRPRQDPRARHARLAEAVARRDTIVTVKATGQPTSLPPRSRGQLDGVTRTRLIEGGVEVLRQGRGADRPAGGRAPPRTPASS